MGLSTITNEDVARQRRDTAELRRQGIATPGYDTTAAYASTGRSGGEPVEIRIAFLRDDLAINRRPGQDAQTLAASLDRETRQLVAKYHQSRHAVVPRGETLIRLAEGGIENGRRIVYYVPRSVAQVYARSVHRELGSIPPAIRAAAGRARAPHMSSGGLV